MDSCDDGSKQTPSSFGQAIQIFRFRAGRAEAKDEPMLFERLFIGLYDTSAGNFGDVAFFDVMSAPPRTGRPKSTLSFSEVVQEIVESYDLRNSPRFEWADAKPETVIAPPVEEEEE